MEDVAKRFMQLQAKEKKIRILATIPVALLGLGIQAAANPPEAVVPFLRTSAMAYLAVGIGAVGFIICNVLIIPIFREKAAIAKAHKNA